MGMLNGVEWSVEYGVWSVEWSGMGVLYSVPPGKDVS